MLVTIVLAAGASQRFGDGAKQLAEIDGRPMLARVLAAVGSVTTEPRIVVLGAAAEQVHEVVPEGWRVVLAHEWEAGPGASLRAGLDAVPAADRALIVLGDLPWIGPAAVKRVLAASSAVAARAFDGEQPGHPVLIGSELVTAVRDGHNDRGLSGLLATVDVEHVDCTGLGVASDVDTPIDQTQL